MSHLSEEIQEVKEELQQVKERNRELEKKIEKQESKETDTVEENKNISRRKFLKMAGLGAGAIGLSSATSAWSILQPSSQGTSDIDADTVDGSEAAGFIQASETDNGGDITHYRSVDGADSRRNLVNISGSGTVIGGTFLSPTIGGGDGSSMSVYITVDGGTEYTYSGVPMESDAGGNIGVVAIPPIKFSSSIVIDVQAGDYRQNGAEVTIKQ
jgi:hypothetical protein